jgi:hypothetical protein
MRLLSGSDLSAKQGVWRAMALAACVVSLGVACGGKENAGATCGAGTLLRGATCVVAEAGADAKPVRPDAGRPRDASDAPSPHADGEILDAGTRDVGLAHDAGADHEPHPHDASSDGDGFVSVRVSCADQNACVAGDAAGPVELAGPQECLLVPQPSPTLYGDHNEWVHVHIDDPCNAGYFVNLISSSYAAAFDLEVYASPSDAACPALTARETQSPPVEAAAAGVSYGTIGTQDLILHVVAEADAACATGQPWNLQLF